MQRSIDKSAVKSSAKRQILVDTPKVPERIEESPVKIESPVKSVKKESAVKPAKVQKPKESPVKKLTSVFAKPNVLPMPVGDANPPPPFVLPK